MDAAPAPEDPDDPPFTQADVIRDVLIYGAAGLILGLLLGFLLASGLAGDAAGVALDSAAAAKVGTIVDLIRFLNRIPLSAWLFAGVMALYGFGALFFRAGPERGIARTCAFGLMMMAGRLLFMP